MAYRECSGGGRNVEDLDTVLVFEDLDRRLGLAAVQIIEIQFGGHRHQLVANHVCRILEARLTVAGELLHGLHAVIINEGNLPILHRCLLDRTRVWAYFYLDLEGSANVPLKVAGTGSTALTSQRVPSGLSRC